MDLTCKRCGHGGWNDWACTCDRTMKAAPARKQGQDAKECDDITRAAGRTLGTAGFDGPGSLHRI